MSTTAPSNNATGNTGGPLRLVLSDAGIARINTAIRDAQSAGRLIGETAAALFNELIQSRPDGASAGRSMSIRPSDYALPTAQWQTIVAAVTQRAEQWGIPFEAGLELVVGYMPNQYDAPEVTEPRLTLPDYPVRHHTLVWSRNAVDVAATCVRYLNRLRDVYGDDSPFYRDAADSWLQTMTAVITMSVGASTKIDGFGLRNLLVYGSSGLDYGVFFTGAVRRCTVAGCGARISDDGTTSIAADTTSVAEHDHLPSYPLDGPQPGTWVLHS